VAGGYDHDGPFAVRSGEGDQVAGMAPPHTHRHRGRIVERGPTTTAQVEEHPRDGELQPVVGWVAEPGHGGLALGQPGVHLGEQPAPACEVDGTAVVRVDERA